MSVSAIFIRSNFGMVLYPFVLLSVIIYRNKKKNAISMSQWGGISEALKNSNEILEAIWQNKPGKVAKGIEQAHFETSHIQYM